MCIFSKYVWPSKKYCIGCGNTYIIHSHNSMKTAAWETDANHYTQYHYRDVIMGAMASQITGASIVNTTICLSAVQRKRQSSASRGFVRGFHQWPANSSHKGPITRKLFPFDNVITHLAFLCWYSPRDLAINLTISFGIICFVSGKRYSYETNDMSVCVCVCVCRMGLLNKNETDLPCFRFYQMEQHERQCDRIISVISEHL